MQPLIIATAASSTNSKKLKFIYSIINQMAEVNPRKRLTTSDIKDSLCSFLSQWVNPLSGLPLKVNEPLDVSRYSN
jgi:hypothetical protein